MIKPASRRHQPYVPKANSDIIRSLPLLGIALADYEKTFNKFVFVNVGRLTIF